MRESRPIRNPGSPSFIDPQTLMSIRGLELRARVVVEGFWNGIHRSPYHGFSAEFSEYRQYTPGDDPRYLDWRVFARSDRYFIKRFEDETNLRCHLLCDRSRSMDFGSQKHTKAEYATTLAATLAWFLHAQGDAVGLLTFDEVLRDYLPARHRSGHLRALMHTLENSTGSRGTDLHAPLKRIVELVRKRGLILLVSDFFTPLDHLRSDLLALNACGHELVVFQILDPVELTLGLDEPAMLRDLESDRILFIDPDLARKDYQRRLQAHCARLRSVCQHLGVSYHRLTTDRPLELALFDFLRERMRSGRRVRRVGNYSGGVRS